MKKPLDIVIPLGPSRMDHEELRYTLRGIEKHVHNYNEIFIVGQKPKWLQGVIHIDHSDNPKPEWKEKNIWKKVMAACVNPKLSEEFAFFNDDHFIIDDVDLSEYPFYYKGSCYDSMLKNNTFYRTTMNHTKKLLERRGFKDINADIHTPVRFTKSEFLTTFEPEHWETKYGYGMKSIYCAFNKKEMTFMEDCKISKKSNLREVEEMVKGRHIISSTDSALKGGLGEYLREKFKNKSSYEQ